MMGESTCMCECLSASWVDIFPLDVFWIFKNDLAPRFYLLLCNDDQRVYAIKIYSIASIERIIMIASLHMSLMIYHLFMNIINLNTINMNCSCSVQATLLFSFARCFWYQFRWFWFQNLFCIFALNAISCMHDYRSPLFS